MLNRTPERARRLAEITAEHGTPSRAGALDTLAAELVHADLLVVCTGAVGTVVDRDTRSAKRCSAGAVGRSRSATSACPTTSTRPSPRSPASRSSTSPGCSAGSPTGPAARPSRGRNCSSPHEAQAYLPAQRSAEVTPTVTALRRRASDVIDAELLRLDARLPDLEASVREEFTRTVRRVVDKLLHTPTVQVKKLAAGPDGDSYAEALRTLFELDPQSPAAVALQRSGDVLGALEAREERR